MLRHNKLVLFCAIGLITNCYASDINSKIPPDIAKNTSISIYNLTTNKPVYNYNANTPRLIASNMKLVTTYVGLERLGKDFIWQTQLGYTGNIDNNILNGNLIIKGGGDPNLSTKQLTNLIKQLPITKINGNIIYYNNYFTDIPKSSELYPEPYAEYSSEPNGLLIDQGLSKIKIQVDNKVSFESTQINNYRLNSSKLKIDNQCNCACPNANQYITIHAIKNNLYLNGTIPSSCNDKELTIYTPNNQAFINQKLQTIFNQLNISYESIQANQPQTQRINLVATQNSESLGAIIYTMNQQSNNLYAKTIFMTAGRESNYTINYSRAQTNYLNTLQQQFDFTELNAKTLENGAGLSRHEKLTTKHMIILLNTMYNNPNQQLIWQSLPTPGGSDNTLGREFGEYHNKLFVKTGTLSDVKAYSGYFINNHGEVFSISFVINGLTNQKTKAQQLNDFKKTMQNLLNQLN